MSKTNLKLSGDFLTSSELGKDFSVFVSPRWFVRITAAATGLVNICTSSLSVASLTLFLIASRCFVP